MAMPYSVFSKLLENVSSSFLQTESWKKVLHRIEKG
jgi:regulator of sirC expression with transglutaminase-like and TPR domain